MRYAPTLPAVLAFAIVAGACSNKTAIHLSCSMVVSSPDVGTSRREAIISIAPDQQNATLFWLPNKPDATSWRIQGHLDERFFTGVVDGDLKIQVSIDRTTGALLMKDSVEPIRRYVGTCEPSKQVF